MEVLHLLGNLSSLTNNFALEKPLSLYLELKSSLQSQLRSVLQAEPDSLSKSDENLPVLYNPQLRPSSQLPAEKLTSALCPTDLCSLALQTQYI